MEAREKKIEGNFSGDGLQNGGLIIVRKGGKELLYFHKEEVPGDHPSNDDILNAFGLKNDVELSAAADEEIKDLEEQAANCNTACSFGDADPDEVKPKKFALKKKT
jgi:prostamide/prostaglandin F2alpha synthase